MKEEQWAKEIKYALGATLRQAQGGLRGRQAEQFSLIGDLVAGASWRERQPATAWQDVEKRENMVPQQGAIPT